MARVATFRPEPVSTRDSFATQATSDASDETQSPLNVSGAFSFCHDVEHTSPDTTEVTSPSFERSEDEKKDDSQTDFLAMVQPKTKEEEERRKTLATRSVPKPLRQARLTDTRAHRQLTGADIPIGQSVSVGEAPISRQNSGAATPIKGIPMPPHSGLPSCKSYSPRTPGPGSPERSVTICSPRQGTGHVSVSCPHPPRSIVSSFSSYTPPGRVASSPGPRSFSYTPPGSALMHSGMSTPSCRTPLKHSSSLCTTIGMSATRKPRAASSSPVLGTTKVGPPCSSPPVVHGSHLRLLSQERQPRSLNASTLTKSCATTVVVHAPRDVRAHSPSHTEDLNVSRDLSLSRDTLTLTRTINRSMLPQDSLQKTIPIVHCLPTMSNGRLSGDIPTLAQLSSGRQSVDKPEVSPRPWKADESMNVELKSEPIVMKGEPIIVHHETRVLKAQSMEVSSIPLESEGLTYAKVPMVQSWSMKSDVAEAGELPVKPISEVFVDAQECQQGVPADASPRCPLAPRGPREKEILSQPSLSKSFDMGEEPPQVRHWQERFAEYKNLEDTLVKMTSPVNISYTPVQHQLLTPTIRSPAVSRPGSHTAPRASSVSRPSSAASRSGSHTLPSGPALMMQSPTWQRSSSCQRGVSPGPHVVMQPVPQVKTMISSPPVVGKQEAKLMPSGGKLLPSPYAGHPEIRMVYARMGGC